MLKHRPILHVPRSTFYALGTWDVEREPIAIAYKNRQDGPEAILQIVEDRMTSPYDRVEDVITRAEIDEITLGYRKIAGFDVEELNRS